jgi:hypothetical protein
MKLPATISMKNTAHGHGNKGMAFYTYEDVEGLGVICDARRRDARSPFVESWRFRWLPDMVFPDMARLIEAIRVLPDEAVEAEKAKWPVLARDTLERDTPQNKCWLHPDRPSTHTAYALTCWIESAGQFAPLCAECAVAADTDPGVVVRAGERRRADCAARKDIL